jgi:hypothetical protein
MAAPSSEQENELHPSSVDGIETHPDDELTQRVIDGRGLSQIPLDDISSILPCDGAGGQNL